MPDERPAPKTPVRCVDRREIAYRQGQRAFKSGAPRPENIWPDEEWAGALNEGQARWLGYMVARGLKILRDSKRQEAVRDFIEHGIDLPPGFNDE